MYFLIYLKDTLKLSLGDDLQMTYQNMSRICLIGDYLQMYYQKMSYRYHREDVF